MLLQTRFLKFYLEEKQLRRFPVWAEQRALEEKSLFETKFDDFINFAQAEAAER